MDLNTARPSLTAFQLKLIALITMTIDHLGYYGLAPERLVPLCRTLGRISAPLFLFLITEGMRHTHSRPRYLLRLLTSAVLINLAVAALETGGLLIAPVGNILPTFFWTALLIDALDRIRRAPPWSALLLLLMLWGVLTFWALAAPHTRFLGELLPGPDQVMYSFCFVLLGAIWYFQPEKRGQSLTLFTVLAAIPGLSAGLEALLRPLFPFFSAGLFQPFQLPMLLAVPFLWSYNGEKGSSGSSLFFYLYYPIHQMLFPYLALLLWGKL